MMRTKMMSLLLFLVCIGTAAISGWLLATARANGLQRTGNVPAGFTYQGELHAEGVPTSGRYDFQFSLWDAGSGGSQVGTTVQRPGIEVTEGRFTTSLDFGDVFDGRDLFLQITIRSSGSSGPYTTLEPRQRLTATPYAAHAGTVSWSGLLDVPAGFADGVDDDTIYSAGVGLRLSGSQLDVVGMPLHFFEDTVVDGSSSSVADSSVITGRDGLPLISYHDAENGDLKIAHCADLICSQATITTLDSAGVTGKYTSITLGRDGNGLISYYDETNSSLKLAHCQNLACTSAILTVVDAGGNVGQFSSITTDSNGYAFISYYDAGNRDLKVASCTNLPCSNAAIYIVDESGDVGQHTSVTRSGDGNAYISYYDATNGDLKLARCLQMNCSTPETTDVDGSGFTGGVEHDVGRYTSITMAHDGAPLIAYTKTYRVPSDPAQVRLAHCGNSTCTITSWLGVIASSSESDWQGVSLTVGGDGLGLITFTSTETAQLYTAHCNDVSCSGQSIVSDTGSSSAFDTSVTVGVDGLPLISYSANTEGALRIIHCSELACEPYLRRR